MKDKTFFLKLLILAESDNKTYKHLKDHQELIPEIERDDFPGEYKKERGGDEEKLDLSRKLLQLPPHSTVLDPGRLAELFYLIGFYEEPTPDPKEFLKLARTNPPKAIKFLDQAPASWAHFSGQVVPELNKSIENITADPSKINDLNFISPVKNMITTSALAFSEYGNKENSEHKQLFKSFISLFKPLLPTIGDNIVNMIDKESQLLDVNLDFASIEFWQQYLLAPRFQDAARFSEIVKALDQQKLLSSDVVKPILDKTLSFLETNCDLMVVLIREKELLKTKNSKEFQNQLISFFVSHGEPHRVCLFNLFKEVAILEEFQEQIIDDLLAKLDYQKLAEVLDSKQLRSSLVSQRTKNLKDLLIQNADFSNQQCIELITKLWQPANATAFGLFDSNFLNNYIDRANLISDLNIKKLYINLLTADEILKEAENQGAQRMCSAVLQKLNNELHGSYKTPEGKQIIQMKRKLTIAAKKLKGGGKYAKGSARGARKQTKRRK